MDLNRVLGILRLVLVHSRQIVVTLCVLQGQRCLGSLALVPVQRSPGLSQVGEWRTYSLCSGCLLTPADGVEDTVGEAIWNSEHADSP